MKTHVHKKAGLLGAVLLRTAQNLNQPGHPSPGEWTDCGRVTQRGITQPKTRTTQYSARWMNIKNTILSERSQTHKKICHVIPLRLSARTGYNWTGWWDNSCLGYSCVCRGSGERYCLKEGKRELSGTLIIFSLDYSLVTQVYTFVKIHSEIYLRLMHFTVCKVCLKEEPLMYKIVF